MKKFRAACIKKIAFGQGNFIFDNESKVSEESVNNQNIEYYISETL